MAVGFYFEGLNQDVFAFIHKSIRDYLTVEALFTLLTEALDMFNLEKVERSCKNVAEDIYYIIGKSTMSHEDHLPFLLDLLLQEGTQDLCRKLVAFFNAASGHSLLIKNEGGQNQNPLATETNVLGALTYWIFGHRFKNADLQDLDEIIKLIRLLNTRFHLFLSGAILNGANLREADLGGADLGGANLIEADLRWANLIEANLGGADLGGADLGGADLGGADLLKADLREADLREANLRGADLRGADLLKANLRGADLREANLTHANGWKDAMSWEGTNIYGVKGAHMDFREHVLANGGVELPPELV